MFISPEVGAQLYGKKMERHRNRMQEMYSISRGCVIKCTAAAALTLVSAEETYVRIHSLTKDTAKLFAISLARTASWLVIHIPVLFQSSKRITEENTIFLRTADCSASGIAACSFLEDPSSKVLHTNSEELTKH